MNLFKLTHTALALLLTVTVGAAVAQTAPAQDPPVAVAGAVPHTPVLYAQYGGDPDDYPEDGGEEAKAPEAPKPQNPVGKSYDGGLIQVRLGNSRHFGYRIGDRIPVVVLILTREDVKIDLTSLKQEVLGFDGSDFELAAPARVRTQSVGQGQVLYRIDLTVVTWVPKDNVVFNLDLRYATDLAADGKTPNFKRLTTPDFVVSRSPTADNGEALLEGDLDDKPLGASWMVYPALVFGIFLVGLWPGLELVKWINRIRPRKVLPPKVAAWRLLDRAFKDAQAQGWKTDHYIQVASALRRYLGATKGVPIEPATFLEVKDRLENDPELPTIESALVKCERVIYGDERLEDEENRELVREIGLLIPRPWDQR